MKRLLPLIAGIGILFFTLGVLFLLAAAAAPENWPLALFFLAAGVCVFGGALVGKINTPRQKRAQEDAEWLPIDDIGKERWTWIIGVPLVLSVAAVVYYIASEDKRGTVALIVSLVATVSAFFWYIKPVIKFFTEVVQVSRIDSSYRGTVRQAFEARRVIKGIVYGIPKMRKQFWDKYLDSADEIVRLLIQTAIRTSELHHSGSSVYETWHDKLVSAQQVMNTLMEKLATATSVTGLGRLDDDLGGVTDILKRLDDRVDGLKEVT